MKLEITTSENAVVVSGLILAYGIDVLKRNPEIRKELRITMKDLKEAATFRDALVGTFIKTSQENG